MRTPDLFVPLWCSSAYSFLRGASLPQELVRAAALYRYPAIGITDWYSLGGVVRARTECAAVAAEDPSIVAPRLIIGAELMIEDCSGVLLLAHNRRGYGNLAQILSRAHLRAAKGRAVAALADIQELGADLDAVWLASGDTQLFAALREAVPFVSVAVSRHQRAADARNEVRARVLAQRFSVPLVAAPQVLYHHPDRRRLHDVVTCIRHGCTLDAAGTLVSPNALHALPAPELVLQLYGSEPALLRQTWVIAERCRFALSEIEYRYPCEDRPDGYSDHSWLCELTARGACRRYGITVPKRVQQQLTKELAIIDTLQYSGYFLTMYEIVNFCREHGILCQGRGSAANSAVCYCLGITAIDPVRMDLLFERFLSVERAEPPDIDLDIEHNRREEVIRHVYQKYGRDRAAMVANVVRYRRRSAVRDVGKVFGIQSTALDQMCKLFSHRGLDIAAAAQEAGLDPQAPRVRHFIELSEEIRDMPRHLSIHPGGFLLGSERVDRLVPIENATMEGRTVIQWDKYDIDEMNLFKVDLLGLGALTHLDYAFRLLDRHFGIQLSLATIPPHCAATFALLQRGDTVGVFQLESRAQMAMLPRLKPQKFYDIVVEVSIVRPGPITGGMVHPYLRRRNGEEDVTYPHPSLEAVLKKTLGIPLFQEQVMKLAVVAADYTPGEADQLRRDMAAWRRSGRIEKHRTRLIERMVAKGIESRFAEQVFEQIRGFGEYGFPESHAASFALIAYATAWMRTHYPVVFTCALLNAWPMGFYAPATIVNDARRHGVRVLPIDIIQSEWHATLEAHEEAVDGYAIRMGLRFVKGLGFGDFERIERARAALPDTPTVKNFIERAALDEDVVVALSRAGAFDSLRVGRRGSMWEALGSRRRTTVSDLELVPTVAERTPAFSALSGFQRVVWDYQVTGHSSRAHPIERFRLYLRSKRYLCAEEVRGTNNGARIAYVGLVICRQRPQTAGGVFFATLEDETGFVNIVVWEQLFEKYRVALLTSDFIEVHGTVQNETGVVHLVAATVRIPALPN